LSNPTNARVRTVSQDAPLVNYGALEGSVGFLLRCAQLAVFSELVDAFAPLDLRPAQFSALALIDANPNLAQSHLCAALNVQRANFVAMLDELESRGLTTRRASTQDRRVNTLALTLEGRRVLRRAVTLHTAHERRLLKRLGSSGRNQFALLLAKLVASN